MTWDEILAVRAEIDTAEAKKAGGEIRGGCGRQLARGGWPHYRAMGARPIGREDMSYFDAAKMTPRMPA
jgi:hypothetical protein